MIRLLAGLLLACTCVLPAQALPARAECIAPAKPGGGFDLTCRLVRAMLALPGAERATPVEMKYLPGGIGAVAFDRAVSQRLADPGVFIAFSSGSLLNIAQGKFGPHQAQDVRWLATLGTEYGIVAVRRDSTIRSLAALQERLRQDPAGAVFGAGGTVGSQDWMKAALTAKAAGIDPKTMRFVAFEGGGEAATALQGGHVQVYSGDASEAATQIKAGNKMRVLAVMADKRLVGDLASVPTAKEQGYDIEWPIIRGFYMGPKVSDADFKVWEDTFKKMMASPEFAKLRAERGLFPFDLVGAEAAKYIKDRVQVYRKMAGDFGLAVAK
jgi:putative tricarboxylic transport membrane protein